MSIYTDQHRAILPHIKAALDAGDRVTLLKRVGDDCKLPLMPGFNDPAENIWGLGDFKEHLDWAISKGIEVVGYGVIMGAMSRNRFALDFDQGEKLSEIAAKVLADTGIDILSWPRVRSGRSSPGYHLHARSSEPIASRPLARALNDQGRASVICEIIGDAKQLVGPASLHKSGRTYASESGDPLDAPVIPFADVQAIIRAVESFDMLPQPVRPPKASQSRPASSRSFMTEGVRGEEIADRYNSETSITSALECYGYACGSGDYYVHPANDSGQSVHIIDNKVAHHFGALDPFGCGETSTPFALYAHFEHGGDWTTAVRAMAEKYGVAHEPPKIENGDCVWPSDAETWLLAQIVEMKAATPSREAVQPLTFDMARFPERIRRGLAGLAAANPLLPIATQIMLPFAVAGAIVGKRRYVENHGNLYYPNLWTVCLAPTNSNKTGSRNVLLRSLDINLTLPDSATMEAMLDRLGTVLPKTQDRAALSAARTAAIIESEKNLDGGIVIADEVTGTFKKLLGGDGRNPDRNVEDLLRLAGSGERIEQPRISAGYRIAADLCVSLVGFSQSNAWESHFGHDRYRQNGLLGRIVPCCDGIVIEGLPTVPPDEWAAFVAIAGKRSNPLDEDWLDNSSEKRSSAFGVTTDADPIRDAMQQVKRSEAWRVLADTVGEYANALNGKIIGHALKMAMVCEWFEGKAADWFTACAELVTACYANYFRATYGETVGLTSQEQAAFTYIRANPGSTLNTLRKKLSLRDNREIWQIVDGLRDWKLVEVRDGKRKDSLELYAAARGADESSRGVEV